MYELIRVGNDKLIGEIIRLEGDSATIQVPASRHLGKETLHCILRCVGRTVRISCAVMARRTCLRCLRPMFAALAGAIAVLSAQALPPQLG